MTILRFFKLLSLSLWIGSIFFFAAVVAPALFSILPTRMLAGLVVSRSLHHLHWIGIICGIVYLLSTLLIGVFQGADGVFRPRDLLMVAMMAITLTAHFGIERKMTTLRDSMGVIDNVPRDDPRRVQFNQMHKWSSRMEGTVLVCGLVLLLMISGEQSSERRY